MEPRPEIARLSVARPDGTAIDIDRWLTDTFNDALVVVHGDRVVFESYDNGMHGLHPHQMMSCTKSFAGLFALAAVAAGLADEDDLVGTLVPELAGSGAFGSARFGDVLDMVNSVRFSEKYDDPEADIWQYTHVLGWSEQPPEPGDPDSVYGYLAAMDAK